MGLGSTARKLQTVAERAEQVYTRLNEVRAEVEETQVTVQETKERVSTLEHEMAEQRAILEAIATELDIDVESVSATALIPDAERAADAQDDVDGAVDGAKGDAGEAESTGRTEEGGGGTTATGDAGSDDRSTSSNGT